MAGKRIEMPALAVAGWGRCSPATVSQSSASGNFEDDFMAKHLHAKDYLAEYYMTVSKPNRFE